MTREIFSLRFRSLFEQFELKVRQGIRDGESMVTAYLWVIDSVDALIAEADWSRDEFDRWTESDREQQLRWRTDSYGE